MSAMQSLHARSAPVASSVAPVLNEGVGASGAAQRREQATKKIFASLTFLPQDRAENKEYWTKFANTNPISYLFNLEGGGEAGENPAACMLGVVLVFTVVVPIFCLIKYCIGRYKANQIEVYNTLEAWQKHREAAKNMDFEALVKAFGPERVRRYLLLGDTQEENLAVYQNKFQEFLKSERVVARKWVRLEYSDLTPDTWFLAGTPWEGFISSAQLKQEKIVAADLPDHFICSNIPPNDKEKGRVGAKIQHLNFKEFTSEFSVERLFAEGVVPELPHNFTEASYTKLQQSLKPFIT